MATRQELKDAFDRQGGALPNCCSGAGGALGGACLHVRGRRKIIADRVADWRRLDDESPAYDPVIADLDASTGMLDAGDDCDAAVDEARSALIGLQALLDAA